MPGRTPYPDGLQIKHSLFFNENNCSNIEIYETIAKQVDVHGGYYDSFSTFNKNSFSLIISGSCTFANYVNIRLKDTNLHINEATINVLELKGVNSENNSVRIFNLKHNTLVIEDFVNNGELLIRGNTAVAVKNLFCACE
jgi:hypothetical protein